MARGRSVDPQERYRRFVAETMAKRIPMIVRNAGDGFDAETMTRLDAIARALAAGAPMVVDLSNWPFAGWEDFPQRVNGRRIADAPFFDIEFWMYFRILEAVREGAGERAAQLIAHLKKGDMATEAERLLAETGWLPEPLRNSGADAESTEADSGEGDEALPDFLDGDDEETNTDDEEERHLAAAE